MLIFKAPKGTSMPNDKIAATLPSLPVTTGLVQESSSNEAVTPFDQVELLRRLSYDRYRSFFEQERKEYESFLLFISRFTIDEAALKRIILVSSLSQLSRFLEYVQKNNEELIPEEMRIILDGANGYFETYAPVVNAYKETASGLREYIPFEKQYISKDFTHDRRSTLVNFLIKTGIVHEKELDLSHIVTGAGSGYILNKSIQAINNKQGHIFLIPVPTYGYFIPAIEACGARPLFIDTTSYPEFQLPPQKLEQIIIEQNKELYKKNIKLFIQRFVKFLGDYFPNPLPNEMKQLIDLNQNEGNIYKASIHFRQYLTANLNAFLKKDPHLPSSILSIFPEMPQVKCLFFINPHNPLGIIFNQDYVNAIAAVASKYQLTVIDDLSHLELVYNETSPTELGFFNKSPYPLNVVTLLSPSKALCMAECRVGFAFINDTALVDQYHETVFNDGLFLSTAQLNALESAFIINEERASYLRHNAGVYQLRMEMVRYLLHPELRDTISPTRLIEIRALLKEHQVDKDAFLDLEFRPQLLNPRPRSGLFCVLDFSAIQGKYLVNLQVNDNNDLFALFRLFNMHVLTGEDLYATEKLMIRFPICEHPGLILLAMKRLQQMIRLISTEPCPKLCALPSVMTHLNETAVATILHKEPLTTEQHVGMVINRLQCLLTSKSEELTQILMDYQAINVTAYEIERAIRTLNEMRFTDLIERERIESAVVMLPSNLPLYSLIIFVVIPSFLSQKLFVRPNSILQQNDIISRLCTVLELKDLCPGIEIVNEDRSRFLPYIRQANLVVFTGKPKNAEHILNDMKEGAILVINGAGHNPLVITASADIEAAVDGALLVKGFNGGQDCAGPDAILVHRSLAEIFIQKFVARFSKLKMGSFDDPLTAIGQIHRFDELQRLSRILHENRSDILSGGTINFSSGMLEPTVIVRGIARRPNYQELYAPIAFIHPYDTDQDLAKYFDDPDGYYQKNRMYVSVYGRSPYLEKRDDTLTPGQIGNVGIILYDTTIHDVEIGHQPYGGYSLGASAIIKKMPGNKVERKACPILLPQVIIDFLIEKRPLNPQPALISQSAGTSFFTPSVTTARQLESISNAFQSMVRRIFGENLLFGFIFGSAAKGGLKVKGSALDDLDTFICIQENQPLAVKKYLSELSVLHDRFGLKVDVDYPAEVMTLTTLNEVLQTLEQFDVSIDKIVTGDAFDAIFWAHALSDKKMSFIGNDAMMQSLIRLAAPHIKRWATQITQQLAQQHQVPEHLKARFPGLDIVQVNQKLKKMSPHAIVHLGLIYDTSSPYATHHTM